MRQSNGPPAPDDPGWEDWAEEQLDDVEYDTELGKELAADALRIADGDITKAEFHEKYEAAVEAEFGVDERPTKEAAETDEEPLAKIPDSHQQSRRNVLKAFGGVAAAGASSLAGCLDGTVSSGENLKAATGSSVGDEDGDQEGDEGIIDEIDHQKQLGMVVDTTECIACLQCSKACKEENNTDIGAHWPYVFRYEDDHTGGTREGYLTRHCQHCSDASCTYVCPTQARHKRTDDGLVLTDYDTCIGCRYCQVACPYGVNYLGEDNPNEVAGQEFEGDAVGRNDRTVGGPQPKGVMGKCTYCVHRQDSGDPELEGTTACEQRCPEDVIHFGDMNDPNSDPQQVLQEKEDSNQFKLLPEVGNDPNIVYIGRAPTQDAEPIQGPVAYEDHDMRDGNYEYVIGSREEPEGGES